MIIQENVPLAPYTTFHIGGAARFFVQIKNITDLQEALAFAKSKNPAGKNLTATTLPVFVLGGGSNLLVSDAGFDGLVIKNEIKGIDFQEKGEECVVSAGAGEKWDDLVATTVGKGLYGLENLSWIPGTVGAAPVQNIGAYGAEAKDTISWVEVYNPTIEKIERLTNADCTFGYRDSIFKHERKNNIILRVAFLLRKNGTLSTEYKDIKNYFVEKGIGSTEISPTLENVRKAVIEIRTKKLPDLTKYGTAGSFFKNAVISKSQYEDLVKKYPGLPVFATQNISQEKSENLMVKVPTAWILDNICGFKGARRGAAGVYQNQALVLVNFGGATSADIKNLVNEMIISVKQKTGIIITPEVESI